MENEEQHTSQTSSSKRTSAVVAVVVIILIIAAAAYAKFGMQTTSESAGEPEVMTEKNEMPASSTEEMMEGDEEKTMENDPMGSIEGGMMMSEEEAADVVTVELSGHNFAFSQNEIRVKKGDRVKIVFSSTDGFHDWVIDEFSASTERVNTGGNTGVEFVADKAGSFEYYCSVGSHRQLGMVGTLIVE